MNTFQQSFYLLKKNLRSIVGFEIVYRLFCIALMLPCVTACFQLSLRLAGYHYLSGDRIFSYLVRPTTIVILCFVLLLLSVITVFEIFCLIPAFHASYHGQTISLTDTGLGMTADEVEEYINQIAFSGATDFLAQYKDKTNEDQIIGHFGL